MSRLTLLLAGAALLAIPLQAKAKDATVAALATPAKPAKAYHFELITKSNASPYWLAVRAGADAAAKKYGATVSFEAPASGLDLAGQIGMVNNAVTAGTDGLILAAQNPQALLKPVQSALAAHIPVVTVDSGLSPNIADTFLATSNIGAAAALAKYTADHLMHGKGQYAIVDFNHTASTGIARPKGFMQGMKAFTGIKRMGPIQYSQNDVSTGLRIATTMLTQYPKLDVIFGANDRAALGPAEAVQRAHSKVKVVGFDADLGEIAYIKSGIIQASILQSPYDMGYYAVIALLDKIAGKTLPKRISTPYFLLTPSNLGSAKATAAIRQYAPDYKPAG
ncbi:substrate-binding domain-containing protein [Acidiphilium sp. PA]|uniref:sugar ABC transporter substrate-binding protein n=1 Tax=Acidiphilium sp. PA TaxID=2871705 RepID=UPI002244F15A|nr:substrate-binding domain-containing protein [Acidiphilium sp. PA]MCW8307726.1 substrate-binding domain-containing protein [Acidiphilium sp. PA]